jgi:hypothetical protein
VDPVRLEDVQNLYEYEKVRGSLRAEVIALKARRRVAVGDRLSVLFENRQTVLFQIQEMIRAERIVVQDRIQEEIDVYNTMVPGPGELSATMMIEILDRSRIQPELDRFLGIDTGDRLWLEVAGAWRIPAVFEPGHSREDRISAVHFLRFPVPTAARPHLTAGPAALVVVHPGYRARADLLPETRLELARDLGVDGAPAPAAGGDACGP